MTAPRFVSLNQAHGPSRGPNGVEATGPHLLIDRGLRGGKLDLVELSRDDLVTIIEKAAQALRREIS